jgi:hypothetical protein
MVYLNTDEKRGKPMQKIVYTFGFWSALVAFVAAVGFGVALTLQVVGVLVFPWDGILIFGFSLGIATPFLLAILALHYSVPNEKKIWSHAALLFAVIYTIYVTLNYVVQLGTVIPMTATADEIRILNQTPHSLLWDADGLGYVFMGLATLFAFPVFTKQGVQRWLSAFFLAHGLITPLTAVVYFYPKFSYGLLLVDTPWLITLPGAMLLLAVFFSPLRKTELVTMSE